MPLDSVLHIEFSDDEVPPRNEKDVKVDELASNVRKKAKEIAGRAKELSEYISAFYLDYMYGVVSSTLLSKRCV